MKIRTDFVTNSSSCSYLAIYIQTKAGEKIELSCGEGCIDENDRGDMPNIIDGKLYEFSDGERGEELTTVEELAAALYRLQSGSKKGAISKTVKLLTEDEDEGDVFDQKRPYRKMIERIQSLDEIKSITFKTTTENYGESEDEGREITRTQIGFSKFRKFGSQKKK